MKQQTKIPLNIFSFLFIAILLQACKPDENECSNCESELITSVVLLATDSATGTTSSFAYRDPDGDGGNAPTQFDSIQLQASHTYYVQLLLLDESKTPTDTISNEVLAEAEDHQLFFTPVNLNGISISYEDVDANSLPIGLQTKWQAFATANGQVQIVLKHQPGIKDGSVSTGEADLDLSFQVHVQ